MSRKWNRDKMCLWRHLKQGVICSAALLGPLFVMGCNGCGKSPSSEPAESTHAKVPPELLARTGLPGKILADKSAECLICADAKCQGMLDTCRTIEGNATAGPAAGQAKAKLCADTLDCVIKSRCPSGQTGMPCYCGTAKGLDCMESTRADGSCKSKIQAGLETNAPGQVAVVFGDEKRGGGVAMRLVQCLIDFKCDACF